MVAEELQSTAIISENGHRLKVSKIRGLIKQAVKQAINGNFQPLALITKISHNLDELTGAATRKNPTTDPIEGEFGHLSNDELDKHINQEHRELFPEADQPPAKKKGEQGGHD